MGVGPKPSFDSHLRSFRFLRQLQQLQQTYTVCASDSTGIFEMSATPLKQVLLEFPGNVIGFQSSSFGWRECSARRVHFWKRQVQVAVTDDAKIRFVLDKSPPINALVHSVSTQEYSTPRVSHVLLVDR